MSGFFNLLSSGANVGDRKDPWNARGDEDYYGMGSISMDYDYDLEEEMMNKQQLTSEMIYENKVVHKEFYNGKSNQSRSADRKVTERFGKSFSDLHTISLYGMEWMDWIWDRIGSDRNASSNVEMKSKCFNSYQLACHIGSPQLT